MSVINNQYNNGLYYQLGGQSNNSAATNTTTPSLASLLGGSSNNSSNSFGSPYLVDLSDSAKSYLNSTASQTSTSFTLTSAQQKILADILAKYKDAPYTQDTFNQIQNDLKSAGLSPDQLALQDNIRNFNPTKLLMDALNGTSSDDDNTDLFGNSSTDQKTKSSNFMQDVQTRWLTISTTAKKSSSSA